MLRRLMIFGVLLMPVGVCSAQQRTAPEEYPTAWEVPPGDPVEHMTAGYAKILCSALFITGRDLATAADEDGFFVSPRAERRLVTKTVVDQKAHAVHLTLPNGVTRTARLLPDQGCVTLPRGADSVFFTPAKIGSSLPDPATQPWPMGDRLPDTPLPRAIDAAKVAVGCRSRFRSCWKRSPRRSWWRTRDASSPSATSVASTTPRGYRAGRWAKASPATLMGQLIHEGVYDLWAPAPVDEWQRPDDPRRAIRIADLLRMSSGLRFVAPQDPDYDPARGYPDHLYIYTGAIDSVRWAVTRPPQWPANTVGRYRNSDPLVVNYLIKKAVVARKQEYLSYPQRHLFDRLGIRNMVVEADAYGNLAFQGYDLGSGRDWLRLGLLYLQDGVWNGERLLPEGWADFVRTPAPAWSKPVYGGFFWLNRTGRWPVPEDAYFMAGAGGQYTIIIPTHDLVVVRLGHYKGAQAGEKSLRRALELLMEAVPQVRDPWKPPSGGR